MSLHAEVFALTPEDTVLVAREAFPKGNRYMRMRDELGTIYDDKALRPTPMAAVA